MERQLEPRPGLSDPLRDRRRAFASLVVLFALLGIAIAALAPFFALLMKSRGMRPERIGVVLGAMALARMVANPVWGHIADAWLGRLRTMRLSVVLSAIVALAVGVWAKSFVTALLLAPLLSACWAPLVPIGDAIALAHLGADRLSQYGRIRKWTSLSYAVAIVPFGFLLGRVGYGASLPIFAVSVCAVGLWAVLTPRDRPTHEIKGGRFGSVGSAFRAAPRLPWFLAGILFVSLGTTAGWLYLPLKIVGAGGGGFLVGVAGSVGAMVEIPMMQLSAGALARRLPLRGIFVLGCVSYIGVFTLWAFLSNPVLVTALAVFQGVGFGTVYVSMVVVIGKLVPTELQATGQGLMQTVSAGLSPILGAVLGGFVYQHLGAGAVFGGAAMLVLFGGVAVWLTLAPAPFSRRLAPVAEPVGPALEAPI